MKARTILSIAFAALMSVSCDSLNDTYIQEISFSECVRHYYHVRDGKATAVLVFVKGSVDANGIPEVPFESMMFEIFFMDGPDAAPLPEGTYRDGGDSMEPFTFTTDNGFAVAYYSRCTEEDDEKTYPVKSGRMTVSASGNGYDIGLDMVLNSEWRVKGNFRGEIFIP